MMSFHILQYKIKHEVLILEQLTKLSVCLQLVINYPLKMLQEKDRLCICPLLYSVSSLRLTFC